MGKKLFLLNCFFIAVFSIFISGFSLAHAGTEIEPNNLLGASTPVIVGENFTGTIDTAGDIDFYKVSLTTPGRLTCSVTSPPANLRMAISLYNKNADYMWQRASAINDGDDVSLTTDILDPGIYFIKIEDSDRNTSDLSYNFKAAFVQVVDPQEPNNEIGKAFVLTGNPVSGTIFNGNDKDFFSIYAKKDDVLNMQVTSPSSMTSYLELYNSNMDYMWVRGRAENPGDLLTLTYTVLKTGVYYIKLSDSKGKSITDPYTLSVTGGSPGSRPVQTSVTSESEPNNEIKDSNLIDSDKTVSGTLSPAGDNDWYKINITRIGKFELTLAKVPADMQPVIHLYNWSKSQILSGQPTKPGDLLKLSYNITIPGVYYIRLYNLDSTAESAETYEISTTLTAVNDPYEPDDNYGDAALINQQNRINAYIFSNNDQDWYKVNVAQPGTLKVILNNLPVNIRPHIDIFDLSKSHLAGKAGTTGTDLELVYPVSKQGSYLIKITGDSNNESTSPYTLTVFGAAFTSFAPIAVIDNIQPGSIVVGDTINFTGSGIDTDGSIAGYSWRSDIDGPLSDKAIFTTTSLSIGTHTIYFKVQDNDGIWSTEISEKVYVGSSVSDETEPNGSFATSNEIALSRPVLAKINSAGDNDFFKIYIPGPGHVTVSATNVPANLQLYLELYNANYDYLWIRNAAASDGDDVILKFDSVEPGFYFLKISDSHNAFNVDYTYTLTLNEVRVSDPYENNNSMLSSCLLKTGNVEAFIFPGNPRDNDWYRVWVDKDNTLNVNITDTPDNLKPYIELYDRNGSYMWVRSCAENDGDTVGVSHLFDKSGYVYIRVHDLDGDYNWTQKYKMTITGADFSHVQPNLTVTTEKEDNNEISSANLIVQDNPVAGAIGSSGDLDWFKINVPSPCILHAALTDMAVRGRMRIYDNIGTQIAYREATNAGDDLGLDTQITRPGTYRIMLDGPGGGTSTVPYNLKVSFTFAVDNYEPNDSFGDAALLDKSNSISALIFKNGDKDWYRVMSEKNSTLKVTMADVPLNIRPRIDIYNLNKQNIASKIATNDGQELTLSYEIPESGYYFICVSDVGNNSSSTNPYSLTINGAQFKSYTPVAIVDSVLPNPAQTTDTITLKGHGEDTDGTIEGYSWRSSIDGMIGASGSIALKSLTVGVHDIYFKVRDNSGNWSRETKTRLYFGMPAPGETEPNNIIGQANPIEFATQYACSIDPKRDVDFFRMHIPGPGTITIKTYNPTNSTMKTYVEIYDKNADYTWVRASASNEGDPVTLKYDIGSSGDYFIKISDSNGTAESSYTFSVQFTPAPDPYEPNPNAWNATKIAPNGIVQAYIFPKSDEDWYKVTVDTPGTLTMSLTKMPTNLRGYIETYDRNIGYTWIRKYAINGGEDVHVSYDIASPGTYWIKISDNAGQYNAAEPYKLTTAFTKAPDIFEPNGDFAHSTALKTSPVEAYVFPKGDEDWYSFYAPAGAPLIIKGDNLPQGLKINFKLYDSNGSYLWKEAYSADAGENAALTYNIPSSGFYYLQVTGRDGTYAAGASYRLSVTGITAPPVEQPVSIESEPNNDFNIANRTEINQDTGSSTVTGSLTASGDSDWYKVPLSGPGILTVSLTVPSSVRSSIHIYDGNKSDLAHRDAENRGDESVLKYNISSAGNFYVRINDLDNTKSTDTYTLNLDFASAIDNYEPNGDYSQAQDASLGQAVQALIFPGGDQDWYTYKITQPGILQLEISQVPDNILIGIKVYDNNNYQILQYGIKNAGDPLLTTLKVKEPGTYYVHVYAVNNGAFSLSKYFLKVLLSPLDDPAEPNNNFSDATLLETQNRATGLIYPAGDEDWYSFIVDTSGLLKIQIAETGGFEPVIVLYNDSKNEIARMTAKNKGDSLLFEHPIDKPDRYYVKILDSGNNDISNNSYVLTIEGGKFTKYYPIALIDSMSPNPCVLADTVTLEGRGFVDQDGTTIQAYEWSSDRDGILGHDAELSLSTLTKGDHSIGFRVQDNEGNWSAVVNRNLYITDGIAHEAEYNNKTTEANPISLNKWITGTIQPKGDTDYFKIYIEKSGYVSALIDAVPSGMKAHIEFFNEKSEYMWINNTAINNQDMILTSFYAVPGWYYAKISDNAGSSYNDTYGLKFIFTPAFDPYEPNDLRSTATIINPDSVINNALISEKGDVDFYRVNIKKPGRINLSLTNVPDNMMAYIELYNSNLDYMWIRNSALHSGEDVFLSYDIAAPGIYYIKITDTSGQGHTRPYILTSGFVPVEDPYENNPDFGKSVPMPGDTVNAYIFPAKDQDWYRIYAEKDAVLSLSVTNVPDTMRPSINMYNQDFDYMWVKSDANNKGDSIYLQYTVEENGLYYIKVTDLDNGSFIAPYTLTITGSAEIPAETPQTAEIEPNGNSGGATLVSTDKDIAGTIDPVKDYDWYKFHINSPGILTISNTSIPSEITSKMWVYDSNKNQIGFRVATNPGDDNILTMTVNTAGAYYVRLADNEDNNASIDKYKLNIAYSSVVDVNEPNNNYGMATNIGQETVNGYLFDRTDEDWYRVYIRTPGTIALSLISVPQDLRPRIRLYNAEKEEKGNWVNTNPGVGGDDLVTFDVPQPGFYFVRVTNEPVNSEDKNYSASPYTLKIAGADFSTAPILSPIGDRTIDQGIPYGFTVFASDPDSADKLVYSASQLPAGAQFNPATRTFTWTPGQNQTGKFPGIKFTVSDTVSSDTEAITITVNAGDQPPVLSPIGNKTVLIGNNLTFTLTATDPDNGDTLSFSAENLPENAAFAPDTGKFTWTPAVNQEGVHKNLCFKVTDGIRTDFEYIDVKVINPATILSVTTGEISSVLQTGATISGEVVSDGSLEITERGVVYGTSSGPTINGNKTTVSGQEGVFSAVISGLVPSKKYYVRAYAVNKNGPSYGEEKQFTTLDPILYPPTVETVSVANVSLNGAVAAGKIISDGGSAITERGFVYSLDANPMVTDHKLVFGSTTDIFSMAISGLDQAKTYHVRAYAVNGKGTAYGADFTFTTKTGVPDIYVKTLSHDFKGVDKDTISSLFTLTVENRGTAVLKIDSISLSGDNAAEFTVQKDTCSNQSIAPSTSKTIGVVFSPASAGDKKASLVIPSNDPGSPNIEIKLTGKGLDAAILRGDVNNSTNINLEDAILALKISSGKSVENARIEADVNDDQKIGVLEALFDVQGLSGLRALKEFTITSSAFRQNQVIPQKYTADGDNVSPPLVWINSPAGTKSFVLIMDDPDAVPVAGKIWDHWIVYNIPDSVSSLAENTGASGGANLPAGAVHGINSFNTENDYYRGPEPPEGSGSHRYIFTLYALSVDTLNPEGGTKAQIETAMKDKILAHTSITGIYERTGTAIIDSLTSGRAGE